MKTLVSLCAGLVSIALHAPAWACGGLFCSVSTTAPAPVDQTAERIIFEVDEETITAHVQISYVGEADEFAWVVPVSGQPEVAESTEDLFAMVDQATQLRVQLPPQEPCAVPGAGGEGGGDGCGCSDEDAGTMAEGGGGDAGGGAAPRSPVVVYEHDFTNNYEYVVLGAEETQELVDWLQDNQFNVSDNMTPVMDLYNSPDMLFLALKLREGRDASDIVPIAMTYPGSMPSIPIRLTAVAAQPLMGILVFILADRPFAPANYERVLPNASEILFDANGNTSYFEWVARVSDEADGQLWVAEYVDEAFLRGQRAGDWEIRHDYLSRYYTRMSPHHMTLDPLFQPVDRNVLQVFNSLDLTQHQTLLSCGQVIQERVPAACAFNYCGRDATCADVDGTFACQCAAGDVAQAIAGPDGSRHVTCVPAENPYAVTPEAMDVGGVFDPCNAMQCGDGSCVLRGGFPTCECDENAFASLSTGSVSCEAVPAQTQTFGPGAGSESAGVWTEPRERGEGVRTAGWQWLPVLVVVLGLAGARTRTRTRTSTRTSA